MGKGEEIGEGNVERLYITEVEIESVRHLKGVQIPVAEDDMKHIIFTGRNGCGKTSVMDAMAGFLNVFLHQKL